ncbi:MAG: RNA polymerase sigma factor FliA [Legionella sp.]|nr:MAG: RNA polymerase sigma factor FliA [Legionella sp.]PJD98989.1 MAG: RNA polymerase sigma factor FliA [Legionella sp.]
MDTLATHSKVAEQQHNALLKEHSLLVKRIAYHLLGRLPPSIQLDDLIQAGMMGLLEAIRHYDVSKGASFETYAGIRIKGAMLDEVRKNDWVPRSVHRNSRKIAEAVQAIEHQLGREAKDTEIALELGVNLSEYHEMLQDALGSHLYGFDDLGMSDDFLTKDDTQPHAQVLHSDFMTHLTAVIRQLPPKEKLVLSLYYEQDLNLKEISHVIEVSESRVSQILSQAVLRIRSRLSA